MKPKKCPNCGENMVDCVEYWVNSDWIETTDKPFTGIGYDCYCQFCKWGGCIEPDDDADIEKKVEKW